MAKKQGGRPPRTDSPLRLVTRLPGALKKRLQHRAIDEGRSAGEIIAEAVERYLDAKEGVRK